jgi:hypothetical protein
MVQYNSNICYNVVNDAYMVVYDNKHKKFTVVDIKNNSVCFEYQFTKTVKICELKIIAEYAMMLLFPCLN